jgi:hypothetical protein
MEISLPTIIKKLFTLKFYKMPPTSPILREGYDQPKMIKKETVLESIVAQFEKANIELSMNYERLVNMKARLNNVPPDANLRSRDYNGERLTSGEGALSFLESHLIRYQDLVCDQSDTISMLEKLL